MLRRLNSPIPVKSLWNHQNHRRKSYFITSPIFYVNASPHIGHLYTVLLADAQSRFQQLRGRETYLTTGTDEHGLKIQQAAEKAGKKPLDFCNEISSSYSTAFSQFGVYPSDFVRTTEQRHARSVTEIWQRLLNGGHIYHDVYQSWYSVQDEAFLTELQTEVKPDGTRVSLESGHLVEWAREENYVFKLNPFKERIEKWLTDNKIVKPSIFHNHLLSMLTMEELPDLSVSRSRQRLEWGLTVPSDQSQTVYVWLDALVNYLTVAGFPDKLDHQLWPPDCHVIGKDILKFHAIYWPAFLMAADLELPKQILCHSHWTVDDAKMSKSKGNVVDPATLIQQFSAEGVRYFLLREGTPHSDSNFSVMKMTNYLNSELANTLGNLLNRTTSKSVNLEQIFHQFNQELFDKYATDECRDLFSTLTGLATKVGRHFDDFNFYLGIDLILECLRKTNAYIQNEQPWLLKKDQPEHLSVVLHTALESLRIGGILLQPIVPDLSGNLLTKLKIKPSERMWVNAEQLSCNAPPRPKLNLSPDNIVLYRKIKE